MKITIESVNFNTTAEDDEAWAILRDESMVGKGAELPPDLDVFVRDEIEKFIGIGTQGVIKKLVGELQVKIASADSIKRAAVADILR